MDNEQLGLFSSDSNKPQNMDKYEWLEVTRQKCAVCVKCDLSKNRTNSVFSDGNQKASLMLVGEGPGEQEDLTGKPFVGRAGKLLDQILLSQNITREKDIYICNTVKCRPPNNRVPTDHEKARCREYLDVQIDVLRPRIILLCGSTAVKSFINTNLGITKIRGKWFDGPYNSKMMPVFHPSYLLRNPSKEKGSPKWLMWQDIQEVRKAYDEIIKSS